ncbi:NRAMP family divalent metal transporter [Streptomyces sp. CA-256286]|uniref:NRAMP family divalent metal transporter n=1 Tax=Streptomyces sp. CA-256286 TaxID=2801033 RepID=UPI001A980F80|nr:divalent metal cation transporter [Streptomyces sp. CA-256286]QTA36708.1 divalent metal cation transporter [Streptomyces sp. CA-256286]
MKRFLAVTLGILTAIGGFVDIGDLVASSLVGARFGFSLVWVLLVGVVGICVYAEMAGRVAAVAGRPTFDLVRERLGPRAALANLVGSLLVTGLTLAAELAGVALAIELISSVAHLLWVPLVGLVVWLVIWRTRFETMERVFGLLGLALVVFIVAVFRLDPSWGSVLEEVTHPQVPGGEGMPTYFYYGIALFASAMTPYEVFFFSSGGIEEKWKPKDLMTARMNVFIGFPLGGLLALSIMSAAALLLHPAGIAVDHLSQVVLPVGYALGKLGLGLALIGVFAATFGAALETALSSGYTVAQYFGWSWGKTVAPQKASRFHAVMIVALLAGMMLILTGVDPIMVTEYSLVFAAVALPLTYLPILVVANDPEYMGEARNGPFANLMGGLYLVIILVAAVAAIPLMIATKAGL